MGGASDSVVGRYGHSVMDILSIDNLLNYPQRSGMMSREEFADALTELGIDASEAAQLLRVSARSVRRWLEDEAVPGTAEAAVKAWMALRRHGLAWRPDSMLVFQTESDDARRKAANAGLLRQLLLEVDASGGPRTHWRVDLAKERATFNAAEVSFEVFDQGGFQPWTYHRRDRAPSTDDLSDIRDACYCIAQALAGARQTSEALYAIAQYVARHADIFVRDGAELLTREQTEQRTDAIVDLASELLNLAAGASQGRATYAAFEAVLHRLHDLGFFPPNELVGAVARSFLSAGRALTADEIAKLTERGVP